MITVIDYDAGNLCSVENALKRVGTEYRLTSDIETILGSDKILLPGVGEASRAMDKLRDRNLVETLRILKQPVLGICLGMQLLCSHSEEGDTECIGVFSNRVRLLKRENGNKVPHIGWNSIDNLKSNLFEGVAEGEFVYYVHSYAAEINDHTICTTSHATPFSGALSHQNYFGCQFHPEKSGKTGEQILKNFLRL